MSRRGGIMNLINTLFKTLASLRTAQQQPALVLLSKDDRIAVQYSWEDYFTNACAVAQALQKLNLIKSGQENFFAVIGLNRPETFFILLGIILAGGVPVPINVPLLKEPKQSELKGILANCQPTHTLADIRLSYHLADFHYLTFDGLLAGGGSTLDLKAGADRWNYPKDLVYPNIPKFTSREDDDLLIMPYTSGSTGQPKGVMLSHDNILDRVTAVTKALTITPQDRILSYLSLGHISDLIATFFSQLAIGYTVFFTDHAYDLVFNQKKFRPHFPAIIQTVQPTIFLAVPKIWRSLQQTTTEKLAVKKLFKYIPARHIPKIFLRQAVKRAMGFGQTRYFISAGAAIDPDYVSFFKELGINILDIYGQTENAGPLLINGQTIGDVYVFLDPQNQEVRVRGACVMRGYYNNPMETARVLGPGNPLVLKTGDEGCYYSYKEPYPRIRIYGRLDDGFKKNNGEYTTTQTVCALEQTLSKIEGVEEAVVDGKGKDYIVALIFAKKAILTAEEKISLVKVISKALPGIGENPDKVKNFAILGKEELIVTPTAKTKRKAIIEKFQDLVFQDFINEL